MKSILISLFLISLFGNNARGNQMEEQVLEVSTLNGAVLSDPVIGLTKQDSLYLPLLDMAKILGIKIEQPNEKTFKIFRTENEFDVLDFRNCETQPTPECAAMIENHHQYFLDINYLKKNFNWPLSEDLKAMRITVNTGPKAPENYLKKKDEERPYSLVRKQYDYPAARFEVTGSSRPQNDILNIYESQSFLNHDSDILFSKNSAETNFRWSLSKEIVESNDPANIKKYELFSTQSIDTKYLFSPTQITGFSLSNVRSGESIFDTQNFYEKGPPRWKVELYLNDVYMGETFIDVNGNFSFVNVPVFYGQNRIVYRMTSPLGKTTEVERIYHVSNDFEGGGKFKYQAAFGQKVNDSAYMGSALVNYGITSTVSAQAGFAQFSLLDDPHVKKYSLVGLSFLQPSYSVGLAHVGNVEGHEQAVTFSPRFNVGTVLVSSEFTRFHNFRSLLVNTNEGDDMDELKKVSATFVVSRETPITGQLNFIESGFEHFDSTQQLQARAYWMYADSSLLVESNKFWPSDAHPDLYVEYGKYSHSLRGKYGVQMQDDRYAKTKIEIEALLKDESYITLTTEIPPIASEGSYALGYNRLLGEIQAEASIVYSQKETVANLTLSTNLKCNDKGISLSQEENYRQANIELFAFVDENANGKFDPGEKPYPRLRILENQRQQEYETKDDGHVRITSINPYQRVSLSIVKESIPNIFLTAQDFQSDYILTPAQQLRIDIPVKPSFDVRGTVLNHYYKKLVPLEIVDPAGNIIATTTTSASGNYKLTDLPAGQYTIRVSSKFIDENHLKPSRDSIPVDLTGKAGVRSAEVLELNTGN